jgi:hypothetical protein
VAALCPQCAQRTLINADPVRYAVRCTNCGLLVAPGFVQWNDTHYPLSADDKHALRTVARTLADMTLSADRVITDNLSRVLRFTTDPHKFLLVGLADDDDKHERRAELDTPGVRVYRSKKPHPIG